MTRERRRGFALLAVLWVITGLSALGLGIALAGRQAVAAAHDRSDLTRAYWRADGCAEEARAVIADALPARGWLSLDGAVAGARNALGDCDVTLTAAGARLDINSADAATLGALFRRLGLAPRACDSLVDALLDWRDADDVPRPLGAERSWYLAERRPVPRNGPLADIRELHRVRGFERLVALDDALGVEPGRIALGNASLLVLGALPGFGDEAVARAVELRAHGRTIGDVVAFSGQLAPAARAQLLARYADLVRLTTGEPDAWILTARATGGQPAVTAVLELRLVRAGDRAAIVRRRTWME